MHARQPLPRIWLMTDERLDADLLDVIRRLPSGSGIVFRHYRLPMAERRRLFMDVRGIARAKRLVLMLGGPPALAAHWGADGSHGVSGGKAKRPHLLRSAAVHDLKQWRQARRCGADFVFVSPVFATRSHPDAAALGPVRFGLLARSVDRPVIALGGMNKRRFGRLRMLPAYGWAGIDAFA